jgi:hypothetical protein
MDSVVTLINGYVADAARSAINAFDIQRSTGIDDTSWWAATGPWLAKVQRRWSDHRAWLRRLLRDQQPGDQAKAAVASRTALAAQHTALRLPLGDDAMDGIRAHLAAGGDEVLAGEPLSRSTSFDPH